MFVHHPDGYFVINGQVIAGDVFRRFAPAYRLPAGAIGRIYEPGVRHHLILPNGQQPQLLAWPEGDIYIASKDRYVRAVARAEARQQDMPETVNILRRKVRSYAHRQQQSGIFRRIG